MINRHRQQLMQNTIDFEKKMLDGSLKIKEYLIQKFRYIEEKHLEDFNEYYKQLMDSYRSKYECKLYNMMNEYDNDYKKTKKSLEKYYKNELDSVKLNLEKKLLSKKKPIISESSSLISDTLKVKKKKYLEKVKQLNQRNLQIQFFEEKIEIVLKNYMKMVNLMEQDSKGTYGIDEKKLFEKYLGRPKADDFEQLIQDKDEV